MAITAYTGLPGSGKSYEVVNGPILDAMELKDADGEPSPRVVWTNIPTNIPGVYYVPTTPAKIEVRRKEDGSGIDMVPVGHWYLDAPPGALIVVDECWRYWPAGMKADRIPEVIKSWFAEHRHRTADGRETDILLVTQDLSQVARFARELVDETYRMRKLNAVGLGGSYRVDVYRGAVTGQRPPESQFISGGMRRYKKEGFERYRSHTQGDAAKKAKVDGRGSVWRRPAVLIGVVAVLLIPLVPAGLRAVFGHTAAHGAPVAHGASGATPVGPPAPVEAKRAPEAVPVPRKPERPESTEWTLLGIVVRQDGTGRALLRSPTGRRVIDVRRCKESIEWACDVDGKMVAQWTGNGVLARAQGQTYNKANGS